MAGATLIPGATSDAQKAINHYQPKDPDKINPNQIGNKDDTLDAKEALEYIRKHPDSFKLSDEAKRLTNNGKVTDKELNTLAPVEYTDDGKKILKHLRLDIYLKNPRSDMDLDGDGKITGGEVLLWASGVYQKDPDSTILPRSAQDLFEFAIDTYKRSHPDKNFFEHIEKCAKEEGISDKKINDLIPLSPYPGGPLVGAGHPHDIPVKLYDNSYKRWGASIFERCPGRVILDGQSFHKLIVRNGTKLKLKNGETVELDENGKYWVLDESGKRINDREMSLDEVTSAGIDEVLEFNLTGLYNDLKEHGLKFHKGNFYEIFGQGAKPDKSGEMVISFAVFHMNLVQAENTFFTGNKHLLLSEIANGARVTGIYVLLDGNTHVKGVTAEYPLPSDCSDTAKMMRFMGGHTWRLVQDAVQEEERQFRGMQIAGLIPQGDKYNRKEREKYWFYVYSKMNFIEEVAFSTPGVALHTVIKISNDPKFITAYHDYLRSDGTDRPLEEEVNEMISEHNKIKRKSKRSKKPEGKPKTKPNPDPADNTNPF